MNRPIYSLLLFALVLMISFSCENDPVEASKVTFAGTVFYSNQSRAANIPFKILVRTNPDIDPDTTIRVRIPGVSDSNGDFSVTVPSDGFPAIPFYAIRPAADTLATLDIGNCISTPTFKQVIANEPNYSSATFGAASILKITFRKKESSDVIMLRYFTCQGLTESDITKPEFTAISKVPYDFSPHPYSFFYTLVYAGGGSEVKFGEMPIEPYKTTELIVEY